jgi:hypothetical protein
MNSLIKNYIKKIIKESFIEEDYPESFDMNFFKTLKSFASRKKYCEQHLKRISSGSSRIVYLIDNDKVLKLAWNKKGIAQNEIESDYSNYNDLSDVIAKVFDSHPDNLWIEMELAKKVTPQIFKQVVGFNFNDYSAAIHNYYHQNNPSKYYSYKMKVDDNLVSQMWEDEFVYDMFQYIGNYDVPVGDLTRLSSYGLVKRNGQDAIVLIDYGLSSDVYSSYYN